MSTLGNFTSLGLEEPSANEFVHSPENHIIAAFALGSLFLLSLFYILRSIGHSLLGARLRKYIDVLPGHHAHVEAKDLPEDRVRDWLVNTLGGAAGIAVYNPNSDIKSVGALLSLSLTIGSGMQFGSLMQFSPSVGAFPCQFVVATGYIAVGMTRAKGLYKIASEMIHLKVPKWESIVFRLLILINMCGMIVFRYFTRGVLVAAPLFDSNGQWVNYALCYNRHFIFPAIIFVGVNLILETYALIRLETLLAPGFLKPAHRFEAVWDIRMAWAVTLILFEIACAAPTIYPFGLIADYVPYTVSGIILLIVFNWRRDPECAEPTASLGPLSTFHASQYDKSSVRNSAFISDFGVKGYEDMKQRWGEEDNATEEGREGARNAIRNAHRASMISVHSAPPPRSAGFGPGSRAGRSFLPF